MDHAKGLFGRITGHNDAAVESSSETDAEEPLGSWGYLRGARERAAMIELRKRDLSVMALGYGWLDRAEYEPGEITLYAAGREIRISGRNLNAEAKPGLRLFSALTRHRVLWVREAREAEAMQASKDAMVIESITW